MNIEIRKGKGIEGLVSGHSQVEEERRIVARENELIGCDSLLQRFIEHRELEIWRREETMIDSVKDITDVLEPRMINSFLLMTIPYETHGFYYINTGVFVSKLIRNSYEAGHNGFSLDTRALKPIRYLCTNLEGTPERPVDIEITGNTEDWCGAHSKNVKITVQGNMKDLFGAYSRDSKYTIFGDQVGHCGYEGGRLIFDIRGNAGEFCGRDTSGSEFHTDNEETFMKMAACVAVGNKILYNRPDGKTWEIEQEMGRKLIALGEHPTLVYS